MLGRFAPGIRRADGPGQVTGDVRRKYETSSHNRHNPVLGHSSGEVVVRRFTGHQKSLFRGDGSLPQ